VQRIVSGVDVQDDWLLWLFEIFDEQIHEQVCNPVGLGCNPVVSVRFLLGLRGMLKPPKGRFAGQRLPLVGLLGPVFSRRIFLLACQRCPGRVFPGNLRLPSSS